MTESTQEYLPYSVPDRTALTEPIDRSELAAFVAESKAKDLPWRRMTTGLRRPGVSDLIGQLVPVVIPLAGLGFVLITGGWSLIETVGRFTLEAPFPLNLVIIAFVALILLGVLAAAVALIRMILSLITPRWWWEAAFRLVRFAGANGLRYGHDDPLSYPGLIFGTGSERVAERRLTTTTGRRIEIGNYRYTIRHERSTQVCHWGYVAITLDRRLPHLLLDAKDNDNRSVFGIRTSNLPVGLARDQRLSLGGEFDDKFTLYAPSDYGRDAFYIFAPDLMALFVDRLGTFDVEIIDDTMFVYGNRFDLLDPRTYDWLQELVETVITRTVRRTERYTDDRVGLETSRPDDHDPVFANDGTGRPVGATNAVAASGRRLRRGGWGTAVFFGVVVIGYLLYSFVLAPIFGWPQP
ncbi:hypothetical protein [Microlunatus parietis]|uniref:DUF3137 domain-containing protein n=1 Tax=Microlunatus parietis TaxID=682979 RepID=A0A7Y9I5D8_9ACTN|nr:hypothetical protein [Microlunatus parietis]NYE70612.1 hypothetical protein [Microlunatus parietis]